MPLRVSDSLADEREAGIDMFFLNGGSNEHFILFEELEPEYPQIGTFIGIDGMASNHLDACSCVRQFYLETRP